MPHLRKRHLRQLLSRSLKFSPITAIFGRRQVGKTTLAELFARRYVSLDRPSNLDFAITNPEAFLESNRSSPLVIDECQLAPPLFPAMKEAVRTRKVPGQFLLTGSVRFSSRKAIRESLVGRMIGWELLPLDLSEIHSKPLPDSIVRLMHSSSLELPLKPSSYFKPSVIDSYIENGGMPGVFAIRNPGIRKQKFETQLDALLERDLKLVFETRISITTLRQLLKTLAANQGQPLEWASLSRKTRIATPTLKRLISAFETIYLIRVILTEGGEKRPVLFFEDQGEASYLLGGSPQPAMKTTLFLYSNLRAQVAYRPDLNTEIFQYRTRGGAYVPLCFRSPRGTLGVIPMLDRSPTRSEIGSATSFMKKFRSSKIIFVHEDAKDSHLGRGMRILNISQLF